MQAESVIWHLCILGFIKEFRPSESFLTQYLVGPPKNFTQEQVYQEIYPIGTYSTLLMLVMVFLITDILRYKPIITVHSLAGLLCYILITVGDSKNKVQAAEIFYGLFVASEVAYSTYVYTICEKSAYQKVTSYTRMALQTGRLMSGLVSQLLISCKVLNFHDLNYLSIAGLSCSTVIGFFLPSTNRSLYFHQDKPNGLSCTVESSQNRAEYVDQVPTADSDLISPSKELHNLMRDPEAEENSKVNIAPYKSHWRSGFHMIWSDFHAAFSNLYIVKWSLWWSLTQCGYLQITSYVQNLWQETAEISEGYLYNGAASAVYTILSICAAWSVSRIKLDLDEKRSQFLLALCALSAGILIIFSSYSSSLLFQYISYGMFKIVYQVMMIIANSEVAKSLTRDSHGLIFGFNTFIALVLQTLLTVTITGKGGLELSTRFQFFVYGVFFLAIGVCFGILALVMSFRECRNHIQESKTDI